MSGPRSFGQALAQARDTFPTRSVRRRDEVNPDGLYERALRLQREGSLQAAAATYSEVILADPEFAEAYYGRASICYALGDCDQAINDCTRAIELRRSFMEAHLIRGAACWGKAAQCEENDPSLAGYCEQAISDCTRVIDAETGTSASRVNRGCAYLNRGLAYWALGNKPMAKHDLENAVALIHNSEWRSEAEQWLVELKKPRLLARYEGETWHSICKR